MEAGPRRGARGGPAAAGPRRSMRRRSAGDSVGIMLTAYTTDQIRAAEAALMARSPEGALMERAAAGLAAICARTLGRVYGSRVVLLIGGGDNGGDALYAGARLASRGARV